MNGRWSALAGVLALALCTPQAAALGSGEADPQPHGGSADAALRRLRADAGRRIEVHRDGRGHVDSLSSAMGRSLFSGRAPSPSAAASDLLDRYGDAFGIDGRQARAEVVNRIRSSTGGTVVRAQEVVDGLPVFGGQVVVSTDRDNRVVAVDAATAPAVDVPDPVVSESEARIAARASVAKAHRIPARRLVVTSTGRQVFDPAIVHTSDPLGVRPVWSFEVRNGFDVRETVLVDTARGEIVLHFNDAPGLNRIVCDDNGAQSVSSAQQVPLCATPARSEGGAAIGFVDVDAAYDNLGAVSASYAAIDGIDLTDLVGVTGSSGKELRATVRWCYSDLACPFDNAFWDGRQMVFGAGYAGADDVVGHELTHGYVERTSALFAFHQSGALNESLADVVGEVVDHRTGIDDDSAWTIGEDLPAGAVRSLKDPTLYGQPDRMTSDKYATADVLDDAGAVHQDDGVGNKTAYLISQGGTFNGYTIAGIDGSDSGLAKTGRLYLEVIPRLTSGSEYADLGRALVATCDELAASATGGFTTANCNAVRSAVAATELALQPTDPKAAAPEAPVSCPSGNAVNLISREDDGVWPRIGLNDQVLWQETPSNGTPRYAASGKSSHFGWDPDPQTYGDPYNSDTYTNSFVVPTDGPTYLNFHHAYVFEWYDAVGGTPASYPDGGRVIVQALNSDGTLWVGQSGLPWINGPDKVLDGTAGTLIWGGDSHGYGSSQVDLTPLAGQTIRVKWRVSGDYTTSFLGWWVDDIRLYTCQPLPPSAPTNLKVTAGMTTAVLTWSPPSDPGSGVHSYQLTRDSGWSATLSGATRSYTLPKPSSAVDRLVLSASTEGGEGPRASITVHATDSAAIPSAKRVLRGQRFSIYGSTYRASGGAVVVGMPMLLQRRAAGSTTWSTIATGRQGAAGTTWAVRQRRASYYRVVAHGFGPFFGSYSSPRLVRMRS